MDSKDYIRKLQRKDEKAFKKLVDDNQLFVFKTCMRYLGDEENARDIAQDVFVEAYASVKSFREESNISTWLYRIAVNKSLNFIKKHKRRKLVDDITAISDKSRMADDASMKTLNMERSEMLNRAIASLSENQRMAFTLSKMEDRSYKEIATMMNLSLSSVEALMHRAKKSLQKKLISFYKSEKN